MDELRRTRAHAGAGVHDRVFAAVSHLPHVLAFALVDAFADRPDSEEIFRFAASGFRDFTRIAASSPEMWRDIALANRDALLAEIAAYRAQLDRVTALLEAARRRRHSPRCSTTRAPRAGRGRPRASPAAFPPRTGRASPTGRPGRTPERAARQDSSDRRRGVAR